MLRFAINAAAGAAIMYVLDPDHGSSRRADLRRRWQSRSTPQLGAGGRSPAASPTPERSTDRSASLTGPADSLDSMDSLGSMDSAGSAGSTDELDPSGLADPTASDAGTPAPEGLSLTDALQELAADGFSGEFEVDDENGSVLCLRCSAVHRPEDLSITTTRRLEGVSDPADMAIVLGARCPACDQQGVAICRYGPEASPGDAELLRVASDVGGGA